MGRPCNDCGRFSIKGKVQHAERCSHWRAVGRPRKTQVPRPVELLVDPALRAWFTAPLPTTD